MTAIVVVDGGASRCRLAAYSGQGRALAQASLSEHASLSLGVRSAWHHIEQGLELIRAELGESAAWHPVQLVMGLAGSLQQQKREAFLECLPTSLPATLVTDGYAQLMGATQGNPGICLSVGTGSVLHWLDEHGQTGMVGGWGFPVGDEGSGAWLGMRALQHLLQHQDGKLQDSSLIDALQLRVGTKVSSIQQWTTESRSTVLASLAPLVFEHAGRSDQLACCLIEEAADRCLQLIRLAPAHLPVYVAGSVGQQLVERLSAVVERPVAKSAHDALHGLWLLSQSGA